MSGREPAVRRCANGRKVALEFTAREASECFR